MTGAPTVELRLAGDLPSLVRRRGDGPVRVTLHGRRSIKDLVESVGVPHTEIDRAVTVRRWGPGRRDTIEVVPWTRPLDPREGHAQVAVSPTVAGCGPRRFVADVHLGTLTRRLRWLGFSTWWRHDADDATLARVASEQGRALLSRDRQLLSRTVVEHGLLPRSQDPHAQLLQVAARYGLADALAPATRCVRCDAPLQPVALQDVLGQVPARSRVFDRYAWCPTCGAAFWPGSHQAHLDRLVTSLTGQARDGTGLSR